MPERRIKRTICPIIFVAFFLLFSTCKQTFSPKPRGYFRIDFPKKEYRLYQSQCNYTFEYPVYGEIVNYEGDKSEPCWINIEFPAFKGKIYLTYKKVNKNLILLTEDIRTLAYKHIIKADDIIENPVDYPDRNVYGIIYDIKGNTASSCNFYLTDSTNNFLSGALYFNVMPNKDSLAPVINFFKKDIDHLIETFEWH